MAPLAGMSKYWTTASAMLPRGEGWEIRGVVKGPRQADPAIHSSSWTAWAAGDGQRVEGHGDTAEEAMADLANQLRAVRPTSTVELEPGGLSRLAAPLIAGSLRREIATGLPVLKELLERPVSRNAP